EMEKVCDELGMTVTTALNIFIKKMTREKRIPFDVSIDPFYSKSNMKVINESIKELEDGKVIVKTLEELEAMENE
ncbi:MAG: type II toxin-antitoxin system antitoxin, RelB/DinJ family, partial [Clostridia bacterium]|nr:type II toxin-antitoxin system antitoxin, RelB/DinJ family [Clostridia bacterium]